MTEKSVNIARATACILFVFIMIALFNHQDTRTIHAFKAWEKITGNEKKLTFEEWKAVRYSLPEIKERTTE